MCSSPNIPPPPPPPQEAKSPDSMDSRRKKNPNLQGGTLLTGAGGVPTSALNTGGSTLLGG